MTDSHGYAAVVRHALTTAALFFTVVVSAIQFAVFGNAVPPYAAPKLVWTAFGVHAAVWVAAVLRRVPAWSIVLGWAAVAIVLAVQLGIAESQDPIAPRTMSMTIAAAASLLLPLRRALQTTVAVSLACSTALLIPAFPATLAVWGMAVQIPAYSISICAALSLAFRELHRVAATADDEAQARLEVDRAVRHREIAAEAARRRSRMMHDTVVNTLGAIAMARIATAGSLVARRCTDDARITDALHDAATPISPSIADLFAHAAESGVELSADDLTGLQRQLEAEPSWRRREIIATLREVVTNIAKHAGVSCAYVSYSPGTHTVAITDNGAGIADTSALSSSLATRAHDAQIQVSVRSRPGAGTTVTLSCAPLGDAGRNLFAAASARMSRSITAVMLTEFAVVATVTVICSRLWSPLDVAPPLLMWLLVAIILVTIVREAGRGVVLPTGTVAIILSGMAAMSVVYNMSGAGDAACGLQPTLAWSGDAVAAICIVLVLVDGRKRVVLSAMLIPLFGVVMTLRRHLADCGGLTLSLFAADLLVIGACYLLRHQTLRLANTASAHHDERVHRREQQERLAVDEAMNNDGFRSTLEHARHILESVASDPVRARDPLIRATARLEEGYLRALIGLTADIVTAGAKRRFVEMIDVARSAGVGLDVNAAPGILDDDSAELVVMTVRDVLERCSSGDHVSIGVFGRDAEAALILVAPPSALVGYAGEQRNPCVAVTEELGLVEVRWTVGAHSDSRGPHPRSGRARA